jgi:hypothetical protein
MLPSRRHLPKGRIMSKRRKARKVRKSKRGYIAAFIAGAILL